MKDFKIDIGTTLMSLGLAYGGSVLIAKYWPDIEKKRREAIDKSGKLLPDLPTAQGVNLGQVEDHQHDEYSSAQHMHLFAGEPLPHNHPQFANLSNQIQQLTEMSNHIHPEIDKLSKQLEVLQKEVEKQDPEVKATLPTEINTEQTDSVMARAGIDMNKYNSIETLTDPANSLAQRKVVPKREVGLDPRAVKNAQMESILARSNINMQTYNSVDILTDPANSLAERKVVPVAATAPTASQVQRISQEIEKEQQVEEVAQTKEAKIDKAYASPLLAFYSSSRRRGR
jgi:hypothetical protein